MRNKHQKYAGTEVYVCGIGTFGVARLLVIVPGNLSSVEVMCGMYV